MLLHGDLGREMNDSLSCFNDSKISVPHNTKRKKLLSVLTDSSSFLLLITASLENLICMPNDQLFDI